MFAKQGLTTFASEITAPTWIISATRASASFAHCTVGENLIREGPLWIILSHRRQSHTVCKQPKSPLQTRKRKNSSRWLFDILWFLFDCFLIVCLLLFALNVLMLLVGGNRTPESDYLSAPLTNSTFILYLSFLITWVPIPFVGNIDWASISLSDDKSAPSLHLNHQRSFRRGKCLNLWNLCNLI